MSKYFYLLPNKSSHKKISKEKSHKISAALIEHVYSQTNVSMFASIFCASIIFIAYFNSQESNTMLFIWAAIFFPITFMRIGLVYAYKARTSNHVNFWKNLYIIGSMLGGISWGLTSYFLLPTAAPAQEILLVLMLAGVSAGSVTLSAAIPQASMAFLVCSLFPFIVVFASFQQKVYYLFDMSLTLYLAYTLLITAKTYKLIRNSVILKFENDLLIHNLEISNAKLEEAATHDALTHVANRRLFKTNLEAAIVRAKKANSLMALLFIDLDNFKVANDRYGHVAGDLILVKVIDRLVHYLKGDENIARLGGDELAIIVENVHDRQEVETIAHEICELVARPIMMGRVQLKVSASIGISIYPCNGTDEETLLSSSDRSMYYVKAKGGNNYKFTEEVLL